ncbi:MAG TPA: glucokinase [Azonexus sp.]|nr:glucokinase [Azonexus sp.]
MTRLAPTTLLAADIGGTFGRFCLMQAGRPISEVHTLQRQSASDLAALCAQALYDFGQPVSGAVLAIAAPLSAGHAKMTNASWEVDEQQLAVALGLNRLLLINDFAALAWSLTALEPADVLTVPVVSVGIPSDAQEVSDQAPRVVFGPGTGLGVAALVYHEGRPQPIVSEGGHIGFAPADEFEQRVLEFAQAHFAPVSWERILSGPGLELIDEVSRLQLGVPGPSRSAAQIVAAAQAGNCPVAAHSIACFANMLGSFGGDLALMFRANGGVVIGGGIALRIASLISLAQLRQRFARKGRFSGWLEKLPLSILRSPNAALLGAARAYAEHFPESATSDHLDAGRRQRATGN